MEAGPGGGRVNRLGPCAPFPGLALFKRCSSAKATLRKAVTVLFHTGINENAAGLAYVNGLFASPDSCNFHLGGPWWQIAPQNKAGCPAGDSASLAPHDPRRLRGGFVLFER